MRTPETWAWMTAGALLLLLTDCRGTDALGLHGRNGPVLLGTAADYGVLAGSAVVNTGATTVSGNLGVSPGRTVSGYPTVQGTIDAGALRAAVAQEDLASAYDDAAGRSDQAVSLSGDLAGRTLAPGLYRSSSSLTLSGILVLDGDPSALYIIQVASTLTTGAGSQVVLSGGAQASNVTWVIGGSASLGAGSSFKGDLLAGQSITLDTGATLQGRALARAGAVTLDSNLISFY